MKVIGGEAAIDSGRQERIDSPWCWLARLPASIDDVKETIVPGTA